MKKLSENIKKRNEISDDYKWRPQDIFKTDMDFEAALQKASDMKELLAAFRGELSKGDNLIKTLETYASYKEMMADIFSYANCNSDVDMKNAKYKTMVAKVSSIAVEISSAFSYFVPEVIAMGEQASALVKGSIYEFFIYDILRMKEHVLSEGEEYILSLASEITERAGDVFSDLENADMKFGYVKDEDGIEVQITNGRFVSLLMNDDRRIREETFKSYYKEFEEHKYTLAALLNSHNLKNKFLKTARKYESSLEMWLAETDIPTKVYHNLIESVEAALPSFYKYIELRKKQMGIQDLHMYDMYAPIVENTFKEITYENGKELVIKAFAPLGDNYVKVIKSAFADGWIDVYENEGKRSGAYSNGNSTIHPFILLNYNSTLDDVFTLAHELGHAMHSYYSNKTQPTLYKNYGIFVAEVASIVNETLLTLHLLDSIEDKAVLKYVYNHYLESFRGTMFRQTMFAKFELLTHEIVERGEALTPDLLCEKYQELVKLYFGEGVIIDEEINMEWSRIPHFYYDFYVYQYATGFAAAQAIAKNIYEGRDVDKYIEFLSAGSSLPPTEALKIAGVDLTDSKPIDAACELFLQMVEKMTKLCEE